MGRSVNYPRREQYRQLSHAGPLRLAGAAVAVLGLSMLSAGGASVGGVLLAMAVVFGLRARHWVSLAGTSACVIASATDRASAGTHDGDRVARHALVRGRPVETIAMRREERPIPCPPRQPRSRWTGEANATRTWPLLAEPGRELWPDGGTA